MINSKIFISFFYTFFYFLKNYIFLIKHKIIIEKVIEKLIIINYTYACMYMRMIMIKKKRKKILIILIILLIMII